MANQTAFQRRLLGNAQAWANDHIPYGWGDTGSKAQNFLADCASAVSSLFGEEGISVGGWNGTSHGPTTYQQVNYGKRIYGGGTGPVSKAEMAKWQPGQVLFFSVAGEGSTAHEAIYAGNGMMYADPETGRNFDLEQVPNSASMYVQDVQQFVNFKTGQPLGNGITKMTPTPGPAGTDSTKGYSGGTGGGSGYTTSTASSAPVINRSMLVRIGIGGVAALLLLIGLDQLTRPGAGPSEVLLEGGGETRRDATQAVNQPATPHHGLPMHREAHGGADGPHSTGAGHDMATAGEDIGKTAAVAA